MKHCLQVNDCNYGDDVNLRLYQTDLTRDKINAEVKPSLQFKII
jgi:hypothetical protein